MQRQRLALIVRQIDYFEFRVVAGQFEQHFQGVVRTAIIDRNHFKIGILDVQRIGNRFNRIDAFIETRNQDTNPFPAFSRP